MSRKAKYFIFATSLLFTAYVLYDLSMRLIISLQTSSFNEGMSSYLTRFPKILSNPTIITLLDLFLSVLAGSGFVILQDAGTKIRLELLKFLAGLSFVLAAWHVFNLM